MIRALMLSAVTWLCVLSFGELGRAAEQAPEPSPRRPNVLFICVDDLKPIAGCYGGTAKTPHIDRLAARGVRFDLAFCNQAVCAPSRNALLTGLRPQTLGIYDLGTNFRRSRPDAVTLPQYFKQHGWRTEALGKIFHVGHGNQEDPASWSAPHWRANVVAYALPESRAKKGLTREEALFSNQPAANLPRGAAYEAADVPDNAYPDGALADEAVRRLAAFKERPSEPFFLAVGFVKPHLPFCAPKKYWDLYTRDDFSLAARRTPPEGAPRFAPTNWGELRQYRDMPEVGTLTADQERTLIHGYHAATSYMDAQLGRVLDAIDANELAKNTVIVLWGDHGWHLGDHGMWCKHTNYEQAARIPLIVVAPGAAAGAKSASLVESVDIYPTLCELAGIATPKDIDGASFAATLKQPATTVEDVALHVYPRGNRIGRAVRTARHRLVEWKVPGAPAESAEVELYDYEKDPAETKNLAAEQHETAAELRAILAKQPQARPQIAVAAQNSKTAKGKRTEASKGSSTMIEFLKDHQAVTLKNESSKTVLRYQIKGGVDENLSVPSACYFHPFTTPRGLTVTEVAPADHRHHRGIFLAFVEMHGEKDADFWGWGEHAPKEGRVIVNRAVTAGEGKQPGIVAQNEWTADGKVIVKEQLAARLLLPDERANVLDLHYTLTPTSDVTLTQWAFSGFCVRTRKDAELTAIGPNGEVKLPNPSHLKPHSDWPAERWYAYELRLKDNTAFGVALIDHPKNPPSLWHNHRDIRMLNPCILAPGEVKLAAGKPLMLRYRVVAFDGRTVSEELNRLATAFAEIQ
jgi:iduronate 2-sulfatase